MDFESLINWNSASIINKLILNLHPKRVLFAVFSGLRVLMLGGAMAFVETIVFCVELQEAVRLAAAAVLTWGLAGRLKGLVSKAFSFCQAGEQSTSRRSLIPRSLMPDLRGVSSFC